MKKCAFTICTESYIGIATAARDSFMAYHPDYDYFIVLVDGSNTSTDYILHSKKVLAGYMSESEIVQMQFQYDVTEFCTSVKPYSILFFLTKGYELAVYLDPDIQFFSRFRELDTEKYVVYLTPHVIELGEDKENSENILRCGMFNCGFIGFRNSEKTRSFLTWWGRMLKTECYDDSRKGIYTDQKWVNFVPVYFDKEEFFIVKNIGCNVAPWNFNERRISNTEDGVYVIPRDSNQNKTGYELCFIHFSGFDYSGLMNNMIEHKQNNTCVYLDIEPYLIQYGEYLTRYDALKDLQKGYKYNSFSNNTPIISFHRRLYAEFGTRFKNSPFDAGGDYYKFLLSKKLLCKLNQTKSTAQEKEAIVENKYKSYVVKLFSLALHVLKIEKYTKFLKAMKLYAREDHHGWLVGNEDK